MTPLLVLNGDEIVEASLLRPVEGECGASPTPEEGVALLGNIKPDVKHKIKLPQVPEQLEICVQVQPAEQTATPKASLLSPPSQPNHLPSQKAKKPWEKATGADNGAGLTLRRNIDCLSGGKSFDPYSSTLVIQKSRNWPTNKLWPSRYPLCS